MRSRRFWLATILLLALLGLGTWYYGFEYHPNSSAAAQHTQTPTVTGWQTVKTLTGPSTGDSTKKTDTFTVTGPWQISWACQGTKGVDDWLYIAIYNPDGTLYNAGAQITCIAAKQVVGSVQEADGGKYYLTIDADTSWTINIKDAK